MTLAELVTMWRQDADVFVRYGDEQMVAVCRSHALALEQAMALLAEEPLDLSAAAAESGFSRDRLRHLIADGKIPNAGRRGAPRVRRQDLPRKPRPDGTSFDAKNLAFSVLHSSRRSAAS